MTTKIHLLHRLPVRACSEVMLIQPVDKQVLVGEAGGENWARFELWGGEPSAGDGVDSMTLALSVLMVLDARNCDRLNYCSNVKMVISINRRCGLSKERD